MVKKIIKICLAITFLLIAYLFVANWLLYYHLGKSNLKASDIKHTYIFNEDIKNSSSIIYGALGDSLTSGVGVSNYEQSYPYLVAQKIASTSTKVIHLNYSYPGAKTNDLIKNLLPKIIIDKPDIITLLIGTNDVHDYISKDEFKNNYETILIQLKTKTNAKINVISIPFIGTNSLIYPPFNYYYNSRIINFNKVIKELADSNNINYIDLTTPTAQYSSSISTYYSIDNFHPSNLGYMTWAKIIYDNINK